MFYLAGHGAPPIKIQDGIVNHNQIYFYQFS